MANIRFLTAGESHGKRLIGILEGIPAGLPLSSEDLDRDLKRRQKGYGRGGRMHIESDHAEILSGVRWGKTIGSPIAIGIENRDYRNWMKGMSVLSEDEGTLPAVTRPRPGHADLPGALKYSSPDIRNILERSSARETAMRVALGAVTKKFLLHFGISIGSFVTRIGDAEMPNASSLFRCSPRELRSLFQKAEESPIRCPERGSSKEMIRVIDHAISAGDSLGGTFIVFAIGVPVGVGSHIQWDKRLEGRLARALMSIQAIKAVEVGLGFEMCARRGSDVMDEITYSRRRGFSRKTNYAGGIEGGMTNGMPIMLRAGMKPIPTLRAPLRSIDIVTKKRVKAAYERSDVCAVPAAGVIGEAMVALTIADAFLEKFGGDSLEECRRNYDAYVQSVQTF